MLEIVKRYKAIKDLGNKIPESLLLIDKYKDLFSKLDTLKKYKDDKYK